MALCLPLQPHLPSLECFPSPHGRPMDMGPWLCILLVFSCFVASIPLFPSSPSAPPSLCFFQFLLQKLNPILLLKSFSPLSFSHKVWWGLHLILPAVSCLWGLDTYYERWKKAGRLVNISPLDFPDPPALPNTMGAFGPLWQHFLKCMLSLQSNWRTQTPFFPPNKAVVFISQVATMPRMSWCEKISIPKMQLALTSHQLWRGH